MSAPSSLSPSLISLGKFDFARKKALYEKDEKNKIAHSSFKYDKKDATVKFQAYTAADKILVSQYGLSLPITVEDEKDLELLQKFSEFIPSYLDSKDEKDWSTTDFVKDDDKIFLKLKFDHNKNAAFKSNIPISVKKPGDAPIHNDQKVEVTATLKFYFNFEESMAGATLAINNLNFEIDEDVIEMPVAKRVKKKSSEE